MAALSKLEKMTILGPKEHQLQIRAAESRIKFETKQFQVCMGASSASMGAAYITWQQMSGMRVACCVVM